MGGGPASVANRTRVNTQIVRMFEILVFGIIIASQRRDIMKKASLAFLISLIAASCALTDITSVKNNLIGERRFGRLLVIAPFTDLRTQKDFENELANEFYSRKVDAFIGQDLIPPLRDYSEYELNTILNDYGIDGILVISSADFFSSISALPITSTTTGSVTVLGNYAKYKERTQVSGGYIVKPRMNIEVRLYDRSSGEAAWMSSSLTRGNAFADTKTLAYSMAGAVVRKLIDDGMLLKSQTRK